MKRQFAKFVSFVAAQDVRITFITTFAAPYMVGFVLLLVGINLDISAGLDIYRTQGAVAYLAYDAPQPLDFFSFMVESVLGNCYHCGSCLQGLGLWLMLAVGPVVSCFTHLVQFAGRMQRRTLVAG